MQARYMLRFLIAAVVFVLYLFHLSRESRKGDYMFEGGYVGTMSEAETMY